MITSPSNPRLKEVAKLREGRHRRRTGLFLIVGHREVERAIRCGFLLHELYLDETEDVAAWSALLKHANVPVISVAKKVFSKIDFGEREDGVVAVAVAPEQTLAGMEKFFETSRTTPPLLAVLENVVKPGNVGAVLRSANGAGLDGMIVADPYTDLYNPNTIQSSLGTIFQTPLAEATSPEVLDWLRSHDMNIAVAKIDGAIPYTEFDFRRPTAIVLGNEARGLSEVWQGAQVTPIIIPMSGSSSDSLNVSNAAAVLFFEARRQRSGR